MGSAVADAPASVAGGEFRPELPLTQIVASKTNPRRHFDEGYLRELAGSIKEKGLIQPVVVWPMNGLRSIIAHPEGSARTSELFEIVRRRVPIPRVKAGRPIGHPGDRPRVLRRALGYRRRRWLKHSEH